MLGHQWKGLPGQPVYSVDFWGVGQLWGVHKEAGKYSLVAVQPDETREMLVYQFPLWEGGYFFGATRYFEEHLARGGGRQLLIWQ